MVSVSMTLIIVVLLSSLLHSIPGLILPGPCPVFPKSNKAREYLTTVVIALVPFDRHPDTYLFRDDRHQFCNRMVFSRNFLRWSPAREFKYGSSSCSEGIVGVFETRGSDLFLVSDLQLVDQPICGDNKVDTEKVYAFSNDDGYWLWSCYDNGPDSADHDEALIVGVTEPPQVSYNSNVTEQLERVKNTVKELFGCLIFNQIKHWPNETLCEPWKICPKYSCVIKREGTTINDFHIGVIIMILVVFLVIFLKCVIF